MLYEVITVNTEIVKIAEKIILEVNTAIPSFEGLHDIVMLDLPPHRAPYLISKVEDRIGTTYVPCDPDKIVAIVESNKPDNGRALSPPDDLSRQIARITSYNVCYTKLLRASPSSRRSGSCSASASSRGAASRPCSSASSTASTPGSTCRIV